MATMIETLNKDMAAAVEAGTLDPARHGALMAGARKCAEAIDAAGTPTAALLSALLNYLRALGVAPTNTDIDRRKRPAGEPSKLDLARMRRKDPGAFSIAEKRAKYHGTEAAGW